MTNPRASHAAGKDDVALVLVHGIGDIAPGNVLESATAAIHEHLGIADLSPPEEMTLDSPRESDRASLWRTSLPRNDRRIDLVEFNWTSVTSKIRLRRPIDALLKLFGMLRELPALGTIGASRPLDRVVLTTTAWLFQLGVLVFLCTVPVVVGHELGRHREYADELAGPKERAEANPPASATEAQEQSLNYATDMISVFEKQDPGLIKEIPKIWQAALMGLVGLLWLLILYCGVRAVLGFHLRRAGLMLTAGFAGFLLALIGSWVVMGAGIFAFLLGLELFEPGADRVMTVVGMGLALLLVWLPVRLAVVFSNLIRDVVHYLAPDAHGHLRPHQRAIREQLWRLIEQLHAEGRFGRIVLVAHSLGTVILVDLLLERAQSPRTRRIPLDLVTAGSPLRRLIHRLFPDRTPGLSAVRRSLADTPALTVSRWFNGYRLADYVGQALTRSAVFRDALGLRWSRGDPETGIQEHLLTPRYRWPLGHADYWADPRFLDFISSVVLRPLLEGRREPTAPSATP